MASDDSFESRFLSGRELYGEELTPGEIAGWFADEENAYAELGAGSRDEYRYGYHALNRRHGYRWLPSGKRYRHALGVGSAYGAEFEPIAQTLDALTILEPSDRLSSETVGSVVPTYVKPDPAGTMPFDDGAFDLTVCLGTLHHIPNVSRVLHEMGRVTEPGGYALIREPIISMGDWRAMRKPGVTKRERGIPRDLLLRMVEEAGFDLLHSHACVFPLMPRVGRLLNRSAYDDVLLTVVDDALSRMTTPLYRYHAVTSWQKIRPTSLFVVARRQLPRNTEELR